MLAVCHDSVLGKRYTFDTKRKLDVDKYSSDRYPSKASIVIHKNNIDFLLYFQIST